MSNSKIIRIIYPKIWSYKNFYKAISSFSLIILLIVALGVLGGSYYGASAVFEKINSLPLIAAPLKGYLLNITCFSFFCMLVLSSMLSSMSTLFTSKDLNLLFSMPLSYRDIFFAKYIETSFFSVTSAFIIFAVAILAFNNSYQSASAGSYFLSMIIAAPFFYGLPVAIGCFISLIVSKFFPVNQARKVMYYLAIFFFIFLIVMLRALEPEKLLSVEKIEAFANFLLSSNVPRFEYFPSSWIASAIESIFKADIGRFFYLNLTASYFLTFFSLFLCVITASFIYHECYLKYQQEQESENGIESKILKIIFDPVFNLASRVYSVFLKMLSRDLACVLDKDIKTFFRTQTLMVQCFMMIVVTVFYLYNITLMPVATKTLPADIIDMFSFGNIGVVALIVTSYAIRFIFPVFSIEGKAFYIVKTSPIDIKKYMRLKFYSNLFPMSFFALVLCVLSNYFMSSRPLIFMLSICDTVLFTYFICHFNLYLGIIFPVLDASVSEIPASFGGFISMIICAAYAWIALILEAVIMYFEFFSRYNFSFSTFNLWEYLALFISVTTVAAFTIIGYKYPRKLAFEKMTNFYEEIRL